MLYLYHNFTCIKLFAGNYTLDDVQFSTGSLISRTIDFYERNVMIHNNLPKHIDGIDHFETFNIC